MRKIKYIISKHWIFFISVLIIGIIVNIASVIVDPFILKNLIDKGLMQKNFDIFYTYSIYTVLFGITIRLGFLAYDLLTQKLKNNIVKYLSIRLFNKYFTIPYQKVIQFDKGYFISRIYDEPSKIAHSIIDVLINVTIYFITFSTSLSIVLYLSWRITIALILIVPILYFLSKKFSPKIINKSKHENKEEAAIRELLGRGIAAYRELKIFKLLDFINDKIDSQLDIYLSTFYSRVKISKKYQAVSQIFLSIAEAIVLIGAAYEVIGGRLTIGELFAFLSIFWKLISASTSLISKVPELSKLIGYIDRLLEFELMAKDVTKIHSDIISVDRVDFDYNGKVIFNNLDLLIPKEGKVLITGDNGSGKSTLLHLITGFLEPKKGNVYTPNLDKTSALLTPFNFPPGTLKELVGFEQLSNTRRKLFEVLIERFNLKDKISSDTYHDLSEGEKRKVQIVLTLLKDADLYILDEPLSNVDNISKRLILEQILELTQGKTLIVILHEYDAYTDMFDTIFNLDNR
ncbi:ABC transporter transmembrane domain-containing protein [Saccharicrinis aurantiacus]|uniref:ABC transporter transmembrane domain-containing protein n=1 Tax=Saccharicrinis aurantiacus TaxID=1849719 RepID=UPI000839315F|nr:ABC transporter ATP-binding protein [Saccharicrinis aurantiacus]